MAQKLISLLRHGSNELDNFTLVLCKHCQARLALFEPCLNTKSRPEVEKLHLSASITAHPRSNGPLDLAEPLYHEDEERTEDERLRLGHLLKVLTHLRPG